MDYPGHVIGIDASAAEAGAVIAQLKALGYPAAAGATRYDRGVAALVSLFQSQHVDALGRPLKADGRIGPLTWGALFGARAVAVAPTGLAGAALGKAVSQIGVRERPVGSNGGPEVDAYLKSAGLPTGQFWCMSFVHWCFEQAAADLKKPNSFPRTGGVLDAWNRVKRASPGCIITKAQAIANLTLVRPGLVFINDHGAGLGHTGFVKQAAGGALRTVEGNSNNDGSRNGVGVFELNSRNVMDRELKGFLDFTAI